MLRVIPGGKSTDPPPPSSGNDVWIKWIIAVLINNLVQTLIVYACWDYQLSHIFGLPRLGFLGSFAVVLLCRTLWKFDPERPQQAA